MIFYLLKVTIIIHHNHFINKIINLKNNNKNKYFHTLNLSELKFFNN